jgi:HTH-type transcriptional regulator / antitoxin HigA
MTDNIRNQYSPIDVSPPGETLEEVLELRAMSQAELADRTGRPKKTINEIIKGKAAITPETAIQFERVLGIPANFWIMREQNYQEALARNKEAAQFDQMNWLSQVPYKSMQKRGWISYRESKTELVEELLRYFAVASPQTWHTFWESSVPAFKKSYAFESNLGAVAAWLRRGEIECLQQETPDYNVDAFQSALERIRHLTTDTSKSVVRRLTDICNGAGVCVVVVPELPKTRVWGATRWLSQTRPLIQLSARYKTDDHFWFTFFHEAGHIVLHGRKEVFIEAEQTTKSAAEYEADRFAREWLIPSDQYNAFKRRGAATCAAASRFAHQLGIAPGIVVGCLQHDHIIPRTQCNHLKQDVPWFVEEEKDSQ